MSIIQSELMRRGPLLRSESEKLINLLYCGFIRQISNRYLLYIPLVLWDLIFQIGFQDDCFEETTDTNQSNFIFDNNNRTIKYRPFLLLLPREASINTLLTINPFEFNELPIKFQWRFHMDFILNGKICFGIQEIENKDIKFFKHVNDLLPSTISGDIWIISILLDFKNDKRKFKIIKNNGIHKITQYICNLPLKTTLNTKTKTKIIKDCEWQIFVQFYGNLPCQITLIDFQTSPWDDVYIY